jgi:hypothetical protein
MANIWIDGKAILELLRACKHYNEASEYPVSEYEEHLRRLNRAIEELSVAETEEVR